MTMRVIIDTPDTLTMEVLGEGLETLEFNRTKRGTLRVYATVEDHQYQSLLGSADLSREAAVALRDWLNARLGD